MKERRARALVGCCTLVTLVAHGHAQAPARWIEDLGHPERSEAAEIALLTEFDTQRAALGKLLIEWVTATERDLDRLRAALRVVELAGTDAAELLPHLLAAARPQRPFLPDELKAAIISALGATEGDEGAVIRVLMGSGWKDDAGQIGLARGMARSKLRISDAAAARAILAEDHFGEREVACDVLGRVGDTSDLAALRDRLLDRNRPAARGIRHNGFAVAAEDVFRLRAALAMLRLGPTAPESMIAHATLAVVHPHHAIRLQSLRALAAYGPDVAQAVPELMTVACGADEDLAVAALQALLPAARALVENWAALDTLSTGSRPRVAATATRLLEQMRNHGLNPPQPSPAELAKRREEMELRTATAALADEQREAAQTAIVRLREAGARSWPFLVDRYRKELHESPDALIELIGKIGRMLPVEDHLEVRQALSTKGDFWWSGGVPTIISGSDHLRPAAITAYGQLVIGPPTTDRQVAALQHENPIVRLVAARELAADPAAIARGEPPAGSGRIAALLGAAESQHPDKAKFEWKDWGTSFPMDVGSTIRAHAAAALIDCSVPAEKAPVLFRCLDQLDNESIAARALARWAGAFDTPALTTFSSDPRPAVAATAKGLLAARRDR